MTTPVPSGFVKMGNRIVPAQTSFGQPQTKPRKFLIVLQHYNGDVEAAEELASLIADLERTRNHEADVMLMRRADSRELSQTVRNKLESKFDRVIMHTCRRIGARSYPFGPNEMWSDLLMLMAQIPPFRDDYYAFINLETDVVPTRPGWIGELISDWKAATTEGKAIIGFIHDNPIRHVVGLAVYAANTYRLAGGNVLAGGNPQVCFDIRHAKTLLPMTKETPLIFFKYRQPTITPAELFANPAVALYHGVKDGTARAAVRARHISMTDRGPVVIVHKPTGKTLQASEVQDPSSFTASDPVVVATVDALVDKQIGETATSFKEVSLPEPVPVATAIPSSSAPTKRPHVYTYNSGRGRPSAESITILDLWKIGWKAKGWNPVVLTLRDAAKHPRFDEFAAAIEKLPCVGDRKKGEADFYRWLALDSVGGGLMVSQEVLPAAFSPSQISPKGGSIVILRDSNVLGIWMSEAQSKEWVDFVTKYDAQPDDRLGAKPHVTDAAIAAKAPSFALSMAADIGVVDFNGERTNSTERASVAMERFLAGK